MVFDESAFIKERVNSHTITEAELSRLAVASLFSSKARTQFSKLTKQLNVEVIPLAARFQDTTIAPKGEPVLPDFVKAPIKRK